MIDVPIPDVKLKLGPSDLHVSLPVAGKTTIFFDIEVMIDGPGFDYNLSYDLISEVSENWISFPSPLKDGQNTVVLNPVNLPPGLYNFPIRISLASTNYPVGIFAETILTVHLQITPSDTPIITDFSIINANTNQEIYRNMLAGASFDYFSLPSNISFGAHTYPKEIGSVVFKYYLKIMKVRKPML